jgi:hypothetical protein
MLNLRRCDVALFMPAGCYASLLRIRKPCSWSFFRIHYKCLVFQKKPQAINGGNLWDRSTEWQFWGQG